MRLGCLALVLLGALAGCGGGGGGSSPAPVVNTPNPAVAQSVGGVWVAATPPVSTLTLLIAEDGDLRLSGEGPSFGAGAVIVTNGNVVSGSYQTRGLKTSPTAPAPGDLDCTLDGTVATRASMQLSIRCTDAAGAVTERTLPFVFDASYAAGSSLADIAGNYTIDVRRSTNTLNINGDGTLFGMLDNGLQCLMNGVVEIIDANFDLYRLNVTLANCTRQPQYEGVAMSGFARRAPGLPAGAFYALFTGVVNDRLEVQSLVFVPI